MDLGSSSDREYITQPGEKEDDYIEARERHYQSGHGHTTNHPKARRSRHISPPITVSMQDSHQDDALHEPLHGSDIEDLSNCQHTYQHATRLETHQHDTEEGSDIVIVNRKDGGSDIASTKSRCTSRSRSDQYSVRSVSMRSDVQDRRGDSGSESDDEGGYISLDDYIGSRSDCVSKRSLSGDEGEGSDAVGSDVDADSAVGEGSDVAHGSDIASLPDDGSSDDDDDCIEAGRDYSASRRYHP